MTCQGFLSPEMNYSCADWSKGTGESETAKVTGCRVTATTLSTEQKVLFEERVKAEGLEDRIEVKLCDYRSTPRPAGGYDRIISIEMLDVGRKHLRHSPSFEVGGGRAVVQGITMVNKFHTFRNKSDNFIDRYIFPGGYLPSIPYLLSCIDVGSSSHLEVESVSSIGEKFDQNWERIKEAMVRGKGGRWGEWELEDFRRRWKYYFLYCEAGFRAGVLGGHVYLCCA
ncbi:S-adenosyl-L-methionine-dependent methyltransferase [Lindgomyces ingoldianus]|uniref:S-adenosyl-L-methionine-dependent methyltransferase n=1 Tax=Lindgomyces ingoldianus TaxID=673940 RepID=A0ACB6QEH8_9PLEO|nr:S-adenosyl-L-methionine-dependent methyltransferase [Lindgomyces ingoldianus]KAF2465363.1 S-adenosyl-L-methionine-dependent methyltransferase [Lindgomyces ingoldianus]